MGRASASLRPTDETLRAANCDLRTVRSSQRLVLWFRALSEALTSELARVTPVAVSRTQFWRPTLLKVVLDILERAPCVVGIAARDVAEMIERSHLVVRA